MCWPLDGSGGVDKDVGTSIVPGKMGLYRRITDGRLSQKVVCARTVIMYTLTVKHATQFSGAVLFIIIMYL